MPERITPDPGSKVVRLTLSAPTETWFAPLDEWRNLPINAIFQVERVDEIAVLGGTVVHIEPIAHPGLVFYIPAAWFNTEHFRVLLSPVGQQVPKFIAQSFGPRR